jgi:hypothetical protein
MKAQINLLERDFRASNLTGAVKKELNLIRSNNVVPEDCAPFCAPPASKSVALGSNGKGKQLTVPARKINTIANYRTQQERCTPQLLTEGLQVPDQWSRC